MPGTQGTPGAVPGVSVAAATEPLQPRDAACQAHGAADAACQFQAPPAGASGGAAGVDDPRLAAFLARASPRMLEALALGPPPAAGPSTAGCGGGGSRPPAGHGQVRDAGVPPSECARGPCMRPERGAPITTLLAAMHACTCNALMPTHGAAPASRRQARGCCTCCAPLRRRPQRRLSGAGTAAVAASRASLPRRWRGARRATRLPPPMGGAHIRR
jgi:hypothetical protein